MKKTFLLLITMLLVVGLLFAGCGGAETPAPAEQPAEGEAPAESEAPAEGGNWGGIEDVIHLSMSSPNAADIYISKGMTLFADMLEEKTEGMVVVDDRTWGGSLVKSDAIMESLQAGVVDICLLANNFNPTKTPLTNAMMPSGYCDFETLGPVMQQLYDETPALQQEYADWNVKPLCWYGGASSNLMTNFEVDIDAAAPLAGKTIYAVGTVPPVEIKGWGGTAITITATDAYTLLDKGTINGTMTMSPTFLDAYKLAEVMTQVTDFRRGGLSMWVGIGMNLDVYNELPDAVKEVIDEITPTVVEETNKMMYEQIMAGYKLAEESGVKLVQLTQEQADAWYAMAKPQEGWAIAIQGAIDAGHADAQEIFDSFLAMIDEHLATGESLSLMETYFQMKENGEI